MDVDITTIAYLRVFIIEMGSNIILMVVEAQGFDMVVKDHPPPGTWNNNYTTWKVDRATPISLGLS